MTDLLDIEPYHEPPLRDRMDWELEALITRAIRHLRDAITFDTAPEDVARFDARLVRRVRTLHRAAVALGWLVGEK